MRPNFKAKIFLDGGDPQETREIISTLGFLDGQTTNPTLVAKHPEAQERLAKGSKFSRDELLGFYKEIVQEIARLIPQGSVSVEVYADAQTTAQDMLQQGREMFLWIPNPAPEQARYGAGAHIKFPTTREGLKAAEQAVKEGIRVNMTLCFLQQQAAAVYAATRGAQKGQVFVSPFVGRLDDQGENGMDLIKNIIAMYKQGDGHVEVLTASTRNLDHLLYAIKLGSDIITAPAAVLRQWVKQGKSLPDENYQYVAGFKNIPYESIDLSQPWQSYAIEHELTSVGLKRFANDWNDLIF